MNVILCCIMLGWIYLMFSFFLLKWFVTNIPKRGLFDLPERELIVHWAWPFLVLSFFLYHSDSFMFFSHQPFLIFVDSWLTGWCSLGMRTQVPPWLSLSSNGMAKTCSSLFISDTPAVLMVKEGTSLVLVWKLHLNDLGMLSYDHGHGLTRHRW